MEPAIRDRRTAGSRLIALLFLAAIACHQPTARERLLGARALTPAPSGDGSCIFDFTGDKSDTVFFLLGLLDEYGGRRIVEDDDRIERFFCNEANTARVFRRYISRLAREQRLDPAVREETVQQCLTSYYSQPIAPDDQAALVRGAVGAFGCTRRRPSRM